MAGQHDAQRMLLSEPRLKPYLDATAGNLESAWSLYLWANNLAGALHAQISLVEVAVRNSIEQTLRNWNVSQSGPPDWALHNHTQEPLYTLLKNELNKARRSAHQEANSRTDGHPRKGVTPNHDDIIAQLMFGTWVKVLQPLSKNESSDRQEKLWTTGLNKAFPGADQSDAGRRKLGRQLNSIRRLRNRVSHHENLLHVQVAHRLNEMLSVVHKIHPSYPRLIMANSQVRKIAQEDPRQGQNRTS